MKEESKNKFTLKIIFSYFVLIVLALVAGYFIYSEIRVFIYDSTADETDIKLLKTGSLVTELYEAESLSKLAQQNKTKESFIAYSAKIDSIFLDIDSLKLLSATAYQRSLLDSLQLLLKQKVDNSNELRKLKVKNEANSAIDNALKEFGKMESSFGKLTAYNIHPDPEKLSPYERKVLDDWVAYLNENIPVDSTQIPDSEKIDSILNASKVLLVEAKRSDAKSQRFVAQKEKVINKNDLELSQQLRTIITEFEQEVVLNSYNQSLKRQVVLRRSMRLAGIAALLGFLVVALFTFLINRDFWRIQTYRQKLEKEKKFSESLLKSREQLISTVSHDLRTPLHTITGYTELMENTSLSEKQHQYLKHVKSASEYVGNLVNDLLDFSKLEAGRLKVEKVPFVCANLIQETAENLQAIHRHKKVKLFLEIDPKLERTVLGDPFRVRQILTNLIGNAFKFTEEGSIRITAKMIEKGKLVSALIEVSDTGIGIPKEKQKIIFKEFTQADDHTEKRFGGYGLGLTISNKLTALLKGTLSLKSEVGHGSTFTLDIPLEFSKLPMTNELEKPYMVPKLRMLIIDDDSSLLRMLKEMAESMGIIPHIFSNFLAVEKNTHLAYDLVLTDIQMPQVTGFEVLQKLKSGKYKHYKGQPIIAMTGRRDIATDAYTSLGFAQVIQKPFTKGELVGMLKFIGIKSIQIQNDVAKDNIVTDGSPIYDLGIIHSFLGSNEDAIQDVLETFMQDTTTNVQLLKETIGDRDYTQVNHVAHRMLPMFRQLKVASCVPSLEKLELAKPENMDPSSMDNSLTDLIISIGRLLAELEKRTATNPDYSG
tara:strand:+ start:1517 stop:3985 length:2469 start_codon:yes stop_codon:yes gene_type:complete